MQEEKEDFPFRRNLHLYSDDEFECLKEFYFLVINTTNKWQLFKTDDDLTVEYLDEGKNETPVGRCSTVVNINNFSPAYVLEYFGQHINISTEWFTYYHNSYGNKKSSVFSGFSNRLLYKKNKYNRLQHAKFQTKSSITNHRDYLIQEIGICNNDYCLLSQSSLPNNNVTYKQYCVGTPKGYTRGTNYRCGIAFNKINKNECKITVIGEYSVGHSFLDAWIGSGHRINHCYKLCRSLAKLAPLILPPVIFFGDHDSINGIYGTNGNNNDEKETDEDLYDFVRNYHKSFDENTNGLNVEITVGKIAKTLTNVVEAFFTKDKKCMDKMQLIRGICSHIESFVLTLGWNKECKNEKNSDQFYESDNDCGFYMFIELTQNIGKNNIGINKNSYNSSNIRIDIKLVLIKTSKKKGMKKLNQLVNGRVGDAMEYVKHNSNWNKF